jgi:hypothetical protein
MADVASLAGQAIGSGGGKAGAAAGEFLEQQSVLKGINDVVGVAANWIAVGQFVVQAIQGALSKAPDPVQLLQDIQATLTDVLTELEALVAQTKMFAMQPMLTAAHDRLRTISVEGVGPTAKDVNESEFFSAVQDAAYAFADSTYWIRPFLAKLTFFGQSSGDNPIVDEYLPNNGQPSAQSMQNIQGAPFVYDPSLALPAFAAAIGFFMPVATAFHVSDPQKLEPYFADLATILENNYQAAVQGLVMVPVPGLEDLYSISDRVYDPDIVDGQSLPVPLIRGETQPAWHGEIGAVNIYAVFGGAGGFACPLRSSGGPEPMFALLITPTVNAGSIITVYPTLRTLLKDQVPNSAMSPPAPPPPTGGSSAPWTWFYVHMRISNLARFKALYLANSYDQIWTLIQQLRALSTGLPGTQFPAAPPPEVWDHNAHWSLTQLNAVFAEMPVVYMSWDSSRFAVPPVYYPVTAEQVIQRLFAVADNSTNNPYEHDLYVPTNRPRPLSLRAAIQAVTYA